MGKTTNIGLFDRTSRMHGRDDYSISCSSCNESEIISNQRYSVETARDILPKKFTDRGWVVGSRRSKHVCPLCRESKPPVVETEMAKPDIRIIADKPRDASLDERRIINEKLLQVYGDRSYTAGWSDEKVAADLGIPRAWVAQVREFSFGPDVDENREKVNKAIQDAYESAKNVVKTGEAMIASIAAEVNAARKLLVEAEALLRNKR